MNSKVSRSQLLVEAGKGNFKTVNRALRTKAVKPDGVSAAKIIVECCRIFVGSDAAVNINEDHLCQLLTTCMEFIGNIDDDVALRYVQSVFFITNYFFKQEKFELMLQLENVLLPKFMESTKNNKLKQTYGSICDLVHNAVAKVFASEASKTPNELYIQLCMLSLKMHCFRLATKIEVTDKAGSYFKSAKFCELDIECQYRSFVDILQMVDGQSTDSYIAIVNILEIVVIGLLKQNEFRKIKEFFDGANSKLRALCKTEQQLQLCNILKSASQFTVELTDNEECSEILKDNYEKCSKDLQGLCNAYGLTPEIQKTSILLHGILSNLIQYYISVTPVVWSTCLTENTQIALYKLLGIVGHCATKITIKCNLCPSCQTKTNLLLGSSIINLVGNLLKTSLVKQMAISYSLALQALHYLERCCTLVSSLKSQNCAGWKSAWTNVGITIYNAAVKLYSAKHSECNKFFRLLIQYLIKLEGAAIFEFDVLNVSLSCLAEIFTESCHFKRALVFAAIQVCLSPDSRSSFKQWIRIKCKEKQTDAEGGSLQYLTVVCVLEQSKAKISKFCPELNLNLDAKNKIKLLAAELAQYKATWPSSAPMVAVFKKLHETADRFDVLKALVQTWGDLNYIPSDIFGIVNEVFVTFQDETQELCSSEEKMERQLCVALLYAIKYQVQTIKTRLSVADSINNTAICRETVLAPHETPKDPNDECDVVPWYLDLRLDECMGTFKLLGKALSIFESCISSHSKELLLKYNSFGVVAKIADEFLLHCDSLQASHARFICLKIAQLLENSLCTLESIAFLIENFNENSEIVKELLTKGDCVLQEMETMDSVEAWKAVTVYHIGKSTLLLNNQKIQAGYEEYHEALQVFNKIPEDDQDLLLKVRLDFLHVQYLQLPCNFEIEDHYSISLGKFSRVLNQVTDYVRSQGNTSSLEKATLFKINQSVVHTYRWMSLPREVRCYGRDILKYAQQLAIPLRIAYNLIYLAQADLQSLRLDDCRVKLNGLSDILCLGKKTNTPVQHKISPSIATAKAEDDVENLIENFSEIMLDCLPAPCPIQRSLGSPLVLRQPFKLPLFINHSSDCDCFYCMSVEYKNLVLAYINLEAQLNEHWGNMTGAQSCYNGALKLYRHINITSCKYKVKVTNLLSCFPFHDVKYNLDLSFSALLLSYGHFLVIRDDLKKAQTVHRDLCKILSERKYQNMHLYSEALTQYMIILCSTISEDNTNKQKYSQINTELLTVEDNLDAPKTPENRKSKVLFPTCYSPQPESPPKRRMRIVKCDFSDNKAKDLNIRFDIHTENENKEENLKCKTFPASSMSSAVKSSKKNQLVFQQVPVPSSSQHKALPNENSDEQDSLVIPQSPNAYTPNALKVSTALQTRTKMLTRKLKKATVKKAARNTVDAQEQNHDSQTVDVKSIRKNLMSELFVADRCENSNTEAEKQKPQSTIKEKPVKKCRTTRARAKKE